MHISGSEDVSIGLPVMADLDRFMQISKDRVVAAVYKSNIELGNLVVVVYDVLRQPL